MDKQFNPNAIENKWYQQWEAKGYFKPLEQACTNAKSYSIMIPPPNVTGSLHMGHAFQQTIMDFLIRYQRMKGSDTLWQTGSDHAGIATQMVVERQLQQQGIKRHDIGREAFIDKIWQWKKQSGGTITQQMRRLGASCDWDRERFTMDEGLCHTVTEVFVKLYEQGLMYRGKRLVNWDPKLQTAISDLEVENIERNGQLWHFRYPLADGLTTQNGDTFLEVATTRPETMLGDSAVAVHPKDERYQHLIGGRVILPVMNRQIPIIADNYVDPEFGSGCVKITPAHDFNDYEVGVRHELPLINIFDKTANIKTTADVYYSNGSKNSDLTVDIPEQFAGLERFAARKAIVAAMDALELSGEVAAHKLKVPEGDRSNVPIEPLLTDQWFVKARSLAQPAIDVVKTGRVKFVPENYQNMYFAWMNDIQDWCVSRQLWWGHRIPAWYDQKDNVYVARTEEEVREKHNLQGVALTQDDDVLDTWFSSALWTFSTLGWPAKTSDLQRFHPSSVLVTGFDIIFFWVARMIMMTLHFLNEVPFHAVYVTGLIRDERGQKMSKSKGNIIDPLDMIDGIELDALLEKRTGSMMQPQMVEKIGKATRKAFPNGIEPHGTDALRFTLAALASTGRDINWDMQRLQGYRNFCNKIWNASRYVMMSVEGKGLDFNSEVSHEVNQWILLQLNQCAAALHDAINDYRFDRIASLLHQFIWHDYCDWYLELSKPMLQDEQIQTETASTLIKVLESILRLAHPLIPFITEEIWQTIKPMTKGIAATQVDSIMVASYPGVEELNYPNAVSVEWVQQLVQSIRSIRTENVISPAQKLDVYCRGNDRTHQHIVTRQRRLIMAVANLDSIKWITDETLPICGIGTVDATEVLVNIDGLVDKEHEQARLSKEIEKLQVNIQRANSKLGNASFVDNAPEQIVVQERERLQSFCDKMTLLQQQLKQFESFA